MQVKVMAFGIAKDIFETNLLELDVQEQCSVQDLKNYIESTYPKFKALGSYMIAVNKEYALPDLILHSADEIAIIPPVSGG